MERRSHAILAALALLATLDAHAQLTDDDMCRNGLFPSQEDFRIATVGKNAPPRLYLLKDDDGCPQKGGDACRLGPYVIPGDELLLGKTHGEYTCAWFNGKKHESVGWIANASLAVQAPQTSPEWAGKWKQYNYPGYITIANKGGSWYVLGEMTWQGQYTANFGEMSGPLAVDGNHAHFGPKGEQRDDCAAEMTRVGRFLVVRDNEACGGLNVRFNGVYTRTR